ncbi:MAG: NAD+ synthase [Candidatus Taylorbacteria bacterium]|nr:NAD+ synthase [Candidatus Taylorbacteria bacterium]
MRIAILQLNYTVGDFEGNAAKILQGYRRARKEGAEVVLGTELSLFGYPPLDLLERADYIAKQYDELKKLTAKIGGVPLVIGVAEKNENKKGKPLFNSAVVIHNGRIVHRARKTLLPTYDVFDESRYFEANDGPVRPWVYKGKKILILLCEDIWNGSENADNKLYHTLNYETGASRTSSRPPASAGAAGYGGQACFPSGQGARDEVLLAETEFRNSRYHKDPLIEAKALSPDLVLVINGSPYFWGKGDGRLSLVSGIGRRLRCPIFYANQVGGNTDLVFDGRSFAVDGNGRCIGAAKPFAEDVLMVDTKTAKAVAYSSDAGKPEELYNALVCGVRDYLRKIKNTKGVVVGLSGGVDSALVATIAVDALGADKVRGIAMPSTFSSDESVIDAKTLAENLGIQFDVVPIKKAYGSFGEILGPVIGWEKPLALAEENVQARVRGLILMAISNREGNIVLTTGNKSEIAVGYCTLYGDMAGGYAVISDIPKTVVYSLAEYRNAKAKKDIIPRRSLEKAPSAELRPNQKDQDTLPPYDVLDDILEQYVEEQKGLADIVKSGHNPKTVEWVIQTIDRNEYKRRQMPPGPKVTGKAFGSGRRIPIAAKFIL